MNGEKGNASVLGLVIILTLFVVTVLIPRTDEAPESVVKDASATEKSETTTGGTIFGRKRSTTNTSGTISSSVKTEVRPKVGKISISKGNAAYSYQPNEEYISLYNRGSAPVNISGYKLKSDKDVRTYYINGSVRNLPADIVTIPQGALFASPTGKNVFTDIILQPGETAIVTTGYMGSRTPFPIPSFKENMCSGYIGKMQQYSFTPKLKNSCPDPESEPGIERVDTECRKFIERMPTCHVPEIGGKDKNGDKCPTCIDGQILSSLCTAFIETHYNYNACIANHQLDPKFSGKTWRIFLGHKWELWAKEYETIYLLDRLNNLITSLSY